MAEATELSYFVDRYAITSSLANGMTNHTQKERGSAHVTYFCVRSCGLRKISPGHAVN